MDWTQAIELSIAAAAAGVLGSMLGLGGGVFLVPIFTLFFGVDTRIAIGASAVAVLANSVVGSSVHLSSRFTNLRLAMLLEITTATGALVGALIAVHAPVRLLTGIFGAVLTYAAVSMLLKRNAQIPDPTGLPDPLQLGATYYDPATKADVPYIPTHLGGGLAIGGVAGVLSGLLGVGGGVIKVPAMNVIMRVPVKAAAGTSAFMVGITSVASSFVFYSQGKIDPNIVIPSLIGIVAGAQVGSRLTRRIRSGRLTIVFVIVLIYLGVRLLLEALHISIPGL